MSENHELPFDIDALVNEVAEKGPDQSKEKKGPEILPEGRAFFRICSYVELGKQHKEYKGEVKEPNTVRLELEVSGKNYPPLQTENGPVARTIKLKELTLSQDNRSGSFKLFNQLRKHSDARHFLQLLGNRAAFMGEIKHSPDGKYANVVLDSLTPAMRADQDEAGDVIMRPLRVEELRTRETVFVWDFATPAMWDALYISGEFKAKVDAEGNVTMPAKSKNVYQERILGAVNFDTLKIADYAKGSISRRTAEAVDEAVGGAEDHEPAPMDNFEDDDIPF